MTNLLEETLAELKSAGKNISDVVWVGDNDFKTTWENFEKIAKNCDYNWGVYSNLKIVGNDWWLERVKYNDSEWWEFKTTPEEPVATKEMISCEDSRYNSKIWKNEISISKV